MRIRIEAGGGKSVMSFADTGRRAAFSLLFPPEFVDV